MASKWYVSGLNYVLAGTVNLTSNTIKVALLKSTYTPDFAVHDNFDDVSTYEVAASGGYSSGGATLASKTFTADTTNNRSVFDAADISSWTATTWADVRYAVVYYSSGTASTSHLLFLFDAGTTLSTSAATFGITFASAGLGGINQ